MVGLNACAISVLSWNNEFKYIPCFLSYHIQDSWSYVEVPNPLEVSFMQGHKSRSIYILLHAAM